MLHREATAGQLTILKAAALLLLASAHPAVAESLVAPVPHGCCLGEDEGPIGSPTLNDMPLDIQDSLFMPRFQVDAPLENFSGSSVVSGPLNLPVCIVDGLQLKEFLVSDGDCFAPEDTAKANSGRFLVLR